MALPVTTLAQTNDGVYNGASALEHQRHTNQTEGGIYYSTGHDDQRETENEDEGGEDKLCIECGVSRLSARQHGEDFG